MIFEIRNRITGMISRITNKFTNEDSIATLNLEEIESKEHSLQYYLDILLNNSTLNERIKNVLVIKILYLIRIHEINLLKQFKGEIGANLKDFESYLSRYNNKISSIISDIGNLSEFILMDKKLGNKDLEKIKKIYDNASKLINHTNYIKDFFMLQNQELRFNLSSTPLKELLEDVTTNLANQYKDVASIMIETGSNFKDEVLIERFRLKEVLKTIISNAIDNFNSNIIKLGLKKHNKVILLQIKCYGKDIMNISDSEAKRIFEPFFRHKHNLNYDNQTGLGLAFCKLFIEQNNGSINFDIDRSTECMSFDICFL